MPDQERCMCGDPSCPRCFPFFIEEDADDEFWAEVNARDKAEALSEEPTSSSPVER